nr:MAG: twin-arginine translocase subunit TatC [Pseudomonadota bacterium]
MRMTEPSGARTATTDAPPQEPLPGAAPPAAAQANAPASGAKSNGSPRGDDEEVDESAMTLWEHLAELRTRIIRMGLAFLVGAIVAWMFRKEVLTWLTDPFVEAWKQLNIDGKPPSLGFLSPADLFLSYVRLAALSGLVFALPIILYQIWAFVAPGLYSREKRFAAPFVISSCVLFAGGALFGRQFAFPAAFLYLLGFQGQVGELDVQAMLTIPEYLSFVMHLLLAFGFIAELPVLVFFLSIAGIVTHKHLIKFFRYFIVVAFVIAAIVTPPDPLSQLLLAVPLCLLYGLSIGIAFIFSRRREA